MSEIRYGIERAVMMHAVGKAMGHPDCGDPDNPGASDHAADFCPLLDAEIKGVEDELQAERDLSDRLAAALDDVIGRVDPAHVPDEARQALQAHAERRGGSVLASEG